MAVVEFLQLRRTGLRCSGREGSRDFLLDGFASAPVFRHSGRQRSPPVRPIELVARDPDPFLDLGKNLLVRRPEAGTCRDVGGQGLHGLLGLWAFRFVRRIPGIDLVGPPIDPDEERIRMDRKDGEQSQQATGQPENPGGKPAIATSAPRKSPAATYIATSRAGMGRLCAAHSSWTINPDLLPAGQWQRTFVLQVDRLRSSQGANVRPQEPKGSPMPEAKRRLVPVPTSLFARSQSEQAFAKLKAHLRKAEARTFEALWTSPRRHLRPLRAPGMLELPQGRKICVRLNVRCSNAVAP